MPKIKGDELVRWNISIPKELADAFDEINHNPVLERSRYGARSSFVAGCVRDFVIKHTRHDAERILNKFKDL